MWRGWVGLSWVAVAVMWGVDRHGWVDGGKEVGVGVGLGVGGWVWGGGMVCVHARVVGVGGFV